MTHVLKAVTVGLWLCTASAQAQESSINLRIEISGAKASEGQVLVSLFADEVSYMKTPKAERVEGVNSTGEAVIVFSELPAGDYAATVIYDRDSDGKLDTGLFGIPTEKIGFSNNARGRMGPAKWSDARFELTPDNATMLISLGKAKRN